MKLKLILLSLLGIFLGGLMVWLFWLPGPAIRFVGFHEERHGRVASFQIVNDTDGSYSFSGHGPSSPFYCYKIQEPSGWRIRGLGWCGTGAGWHTLAPHSVTEIQVPAPPDASASPFVVGVYFERGTAAQLNSRIRSHNFISELIFFLRDKIKSGSGDPEPIWSTIAQP